MKFDLTVDKKAEALIDGRLCVNCGRCREICPAEAIEERLKTVYCMFPDCGEGKGNDIPAKGYQNAVRYSVESVCSEGCPLGIVPQSLAALVEAGDIAGAYRLIEDNNPMPWICGEICRHVCDGACKRGNFIDRALNTKAIERYVVAQADRRPRKYTRKLRERIAVIGSGPAGLAAAFELSKEGYGVTVFEKESRAGGSLSWGIPDFKMDKRQLDAEIDAIISAGIEMRYDRTIGEDYTLDDIWREGFCACIVAIGRSEGVKDDIPGSNARGAYDGVTAMLNMDDPDALGIGSEIVVVGSNELAVNAARALRRMDKNVTMAAAEMPEHVDISDEEMELLKSEGVAVRNLIMPKQVIREDDKVKAVEFIKLEYIEEEDGTLRANPVKGSEFNIFCDTVIFAEERRCGSDAITNAEAYPNGRLKVDDAGETNKEMLFACGAAVAECGSVAEAIASGKETARNIMSRIRGLRRPVHDHIAASDDDRTMIYPDNVSRIRPQTERVIREKDIESEERRKAEAEQYWQEMLEILRAAGIEEEMPHFKYGGAGTADEAEEKFNGSRGRVAVIGGGISGITAAIDLAKKGYRPTIFEKQSNIGGRLRTDAFLKGIPRELIDIELDKVFASGIEIICDAPAGTYPNAAEIMDMGFGAVLFAIGESGSARPQLENINSKGVFEIKRVVDGLMAMEDIKDMGRRIIITGSDDETFHTARLLKEIYDQVTVLAPVGRDSIEAADTAIAAALETGVNLVTGVELDGIGTEGGGLQSIHVKTAERTIPMDISCDAIILGGTRVPDTRAIAHRNPRLKIDKNGYIAADEKFVTSMNGVFAIGDTDMDAIESGHFGADAVEGFLKEGEARIRPINRPEEDKPEEDLSYDIFQGQYDEDMGMQMGFAMLDERQVRAEAARCMKCGRHVIDMTKCMGCGVCLMVCPANAIVLSPVPQEEESAWTDETTEDEHEQTTKEAEG